MIYLMYSHILRSSDVLQQQFNDEGAGDDEGDKFVNLLLNLKIYNVGPAGRIDI